MTTAQAKKDHLNDTARAALELPDNERIDHINSEHWIGYGRATQILSRLEYLLNFPRKHRMPNSLIVGDTNNGKTMVVERFQQKHMAYDNGEGDAVTLPVLVIQAPPTPDESRLYDEMLETLAAPFKASEKPSKKLFQIKHILRQTSTRILIIDEIHNIIAGSSSRQRAFLNVLKNFCNDLQMPLVGVGTEDAFNAINTDPQLSNRFEPMSLPRWKKNAEYLRLLASYELMLPLRKPSQLTESSLAEKVLFMSEGIIGEISNVLCRSSEAAIQGGHERITIKILESLSWTLPSERNHQRL
jgi:ATP-dependent Clp protease ATP-binding subunit ClpA